MQIRYAFCEIRFYIPSYPSQDSILYYPRWVELTTALSQVSTELNLTLLQLASNYQFSYTTSIQTFTQLIIFHELKQAKALTHTIPYSITISISVPRL
jgi:hypothetical protein